MTTHPCCAWKSPPHFLLHHFLHELDSLTTTTWCRQGRNYCSILWLRWVTLHRGEPCQGHTAVGAKSWMPWTSTRESSTLSAYPSCPLWYMRGPRSVCQLTVFRCISYLFFWEWLINHERNEEQHLDSLISFFRAHYSDFHSHTLIDQHPATCDVFIS